MDIEIDTHTNEYSQVRANLKKIADGQHRLDALLQFQNSRFLQGTLLNALQQIYVPNVQLVRFKLDQTFAYKEGTPDKTNSYGVVAGRPATCTQSTTLILDAKDSSPNPGDQVNRYKEALARQEYFRASLDPTNGVKLVTTPSAAQTSWGGKPYVQFTLECRFPDKTR